MIKKICLAPGRRRKENDAFEGPGSGPSHSLSPPPSILLVLLPSRFPLFRVRSTPFRDCLAASEFKPFFEWLEMRQSDGRLNRTLKIYFSSFIVIILYLCQLPNSYPYFFFLLLTLPVSSPFSDDIFSYCGLHVFQSFLIYIYQTECLE